MIYLMVFFLTLGMGSFYLIKGAIEVAFEIEEKETAKSLIGGLLFYFASGILLYAFLETQSPTGMNFF